MRRFPTLFVLVVTLGSAAHPLAASPISDFQARLAQTRWNIHALEGIAKAQPASRRAAPTPEALDSFLGLLAENVGALTAFSGAKATDEQARVIVEGIRTIAGQLQDLAAVVSHRGFTGAAAEAQRLETTCRLAIADTD